MVPVRLSPPCVDGKQKEKESEHTKERLHLHLCSYRIAPRIIRMRRTGILMAWKFNFPDSISQIKVRSARRQEKISSSAIFSEIFLNSSEASAIKMSGVKFQVLEDMVRASRPLSRERPAPRTRAGRPRHPDCRRAAPQRHSLANITFSIAAWSSGESFLPCEVR